MNIGGWAGFRGGDSINAFASFSWSDQSTPAVVGRMAASI
jgi:hypothetical protein